MDPGKCLLEAGGGPARIAEPGCGGAAALGPSRAKGLCRRLTELIDTLGAQPGWGCAQVSEKRPGERSGAQRQLRCDCGVVAQFGTSLVIPP